MDQARSPVLQWKLGSDTECVSAGDLPAMISQCLLWPHAATEQ